MSWTIQLAKDAQKELGRLPRGNQQRIARAIEQMRGDPLSGNVKPLAGRQWKWRYRTRVGQYRLIFVVSRSSKVVFISAILRRSESTYRR